MSDMKHIFVVGCPRSGTTLIQAILASHSGLTSFPESHIFTDSCFDLKWRMYGRLLGRRQWPSVIAGRMKNRAGIAAPSVQKRIPIFLERAALEGEAIRFRDSSNNLKAITNRFIALLDDYGGELGWVEKTPNNVFCIPMIERYVRDPKFIHVIRDAPDTIASIIDASRKYEDWGRRYLTGAHSLERVIALWTRSTRTSFGYRKRPNHLIVRHKDLVNHADREIERMAQFLGITYEANMKDGNIEGIVTDAEMWKKKPGRGVINPETKYHTVFTQEEQEYIQSRVFEV